MIQQMQLPMLKREECKAERNYRRGGVALVDDGGWIILVERMDHAALTAGVELAPGKAQAALYKKPSQELEEAFNNGRYAAITARGFIEMQGALPVVVDDEMVSNRDVHQQSNKALMKKARSESKGPETFDAPSA